MSTIKRWAFVAEIVGAIAIVMSLIYVGYQVRENSIAVKSAVQRSVLNMGHEWDSWVVTDEGLASILTKASDDYRTLTPTEKMRYDLYVRLAFNIWEDAFYNYQSGMMDEEIWQAWDAYFRLRLERGVNWTGDSGSDTSWQQIWQAATSSYGETFQSHVSTYMTIDRAAGEEGQ